MSAPHLEPWTEAGGFVFVSGQLPFDGNGRISGEGIAAQTARTLENIAATLRSAGLSMTDVVKTSVWLRNSEDFVAFNNGYAAVFGEHRPARTTVVSPLLIPEALLEIEAVAYRSA